MPAMVAPAQNVAKTLVALSAREAVADIVFELSGISHGLEYDNTTTPCELPAAILALRRRDANLAKDAKTADEGWRQGAIQVRGPSCEDSKMSQVRIRGSWSCRIQALRPSAESGFVRSGICLTSAPRRCQLNEFERKKVY